jgi:hypothetical protein
MLYLRSLAHDPFGDGANGNRNRKVEIHIQPGQCGRRLDDKYRVVTCLPPPQSSAVESGRLDSIIARFCPSAGRQGLLQQYRPQADSCTESSPNGRHRCAFTRGVIFRFSEHR